jgi:biotin operon repressor
MVNPFINTVLMRLHHLIKIKGTGSPEVLAQKLSCSERTARQKIEHLKEAGLPIAYCKQRQTYYYTEEVNISVTLVLGEKEMHRIVGGKSNAVLTEPFKRRLLFLLFLICFFNASTKAQFLPHVAKHLDEVNIATVFLAENNVDSAISHYENAVHYFDEAKYIWSDLGDLYVKKEAYAKAMDAYSNAILKGAFSGIDIRSGDYKKQFDKPQLLPLVQRLDSLFSVFYIQTYNAEFTLLVQELKGAEQAPRIILDRIDEKDTIRTKELYKLFAFVDTAYNLPKLLDYLDNHPFPKESSLNGDVGSDLWLLVHHILQYHNSHPKVARLAKYIEGAVYAGQFNIKGYVTTLDYQHFNCCAKQLYGMFKKQSKEGIYSFYPEIEHIESIDKRRAAWHLLPLYLQKKVDADWYPALPASYDPATQEK